MSDRTLPPDAAMTLDQIGDWLVETASAAALAHLAATALRRIRASAEAILADALGRLAGSRRAWAEADRIADMMAAATPPEDLAAAPVAPARGALRLVPNGPSRRDGRHGRTLDQLSIMCRQAWERHQSKAGDADFVPPFDPAQIAMGLRYQALVERHAAAGVKCASAEVRAVARSGGDGDFMAAFLSESRELETIRHRIGPGLALEVRRGSPGRRDIPIRTLVDAVCLHGKDLSAVLKGHGWSKKTDSLTALRRALAAALDRMQGYR